MLFISNKTQKKLTFLKDDKLREQIFVKVWKKQLDKKMNYFFRWSCIFGKRSEN